MRSLGLIRLWFELPALDTDIRTDKCDLACDIPR
jgi:hypothetical protein